jgi:hypothetical protein
MPQTLDDLLTILPGLGRLRSLDAEMLRTLLNRRSGECTWCGYVVPKGKREWCGDNCLAAFQSRCDPTYARRLVLARDNGVCQVCGRDTFQAERDFEAERRQLEASRVIDSLVLNPIRAKYGFARGRWREVDHRVPVSEGGGLADPSSLRVLCGLCHASVTAAASRRRAARR